MARNFTMSSREAIVRRAINKYLKDSGWRQRGGTFVREGSVGGHSMKNAFEFQAGRDDLFREKSIEETEAAE